MRDIATICDNFKIRPSEYVGIENEVLKMDFDRAVNFELQHYKAKREIDFIKAVNIAVLLAFGGKTLEIDTDDDYDDFEENSESESQGEGIWLNGRWQKLSDVPEAP